MKCIAKNRYCRISPTKLRRISKVVKGEYVGDALAFLQFLPNRGSKFITKTLKSAMANASVKDMDEDNLIVDNVIIDQGPSLKRFRPRAMGRATRIKKRMSHITVILDDLQPEEE